jgi:peroxiredoxin
MNNLCDTIQNKLVKLHLTGMPIKDDPEVKAHLEACSTCRIYYDFLNHDHQTSEICAESLEIYVDQVKHKLHHHIKLTKPGSRRQSTFLGWAAAVFIPLTIGLLFLFNNNSKTASNRPGPDQGSQTAKAPTVQAPIAPIEQRSQDPKTMAPELEPTAKAPSVGHDIYPDANGMQFEVAVTHKETNQPLAGVEVLFRSEPGFSDDIQEATGLTDANGICRIGHEKTSLLEAIIRVGKPGFVLMGAEFKDLNQQESPFRIDVALEPGSAIGGTVSDPNGDPLGGVQVGFDSGYRRFQKKKAFPYFEYEGETNLQGHWSADAISEAIGSLSIRFSHPDYAETEHTIINPGLPDPNGEALTALREQTYETTLSPGFSVWGQVTDPNGSPVAGAEVKCNQHEKTVTTDANGQYLFDHLPLDITSVNIVVTAEAYAPTAMYRIFGDREQPINIALHKGQATEEEMVKYVGTVLTAQGNPVPDIQVFLCEHALELSVRNGIPRNSLDFVHTDADGRFLMESERLVKYIVAVGAQGICQSEYDGFRKRRVMTVEPWVTVKGDLVMGTYPAAGYMLETHTRDEIEYRGGYSSNSHCNTDAHGRFEFSRIPPGSMILHGREYEVHAGQTYELHLGMGGLSVVGQFILPEEAHQGDILSGGPIMSHVISLNTNNNSANIPPRPELVKSHVFQQISSNETGQFQGDHLGPGFYALVGGALENGNWNRQKHAYRLWHEFVVPRPSDAVQGKILIELGNVELIPGDLMVGDSAPDFDLADLAGNMQSLTDLAEKLVLLSFCRSDDLQKPSRELRRLKEVQNKFGTMESFVLIGMLASTDSPYENSELVHAAGLTWPHLPVGRNQLNRTHIEYDVLNTSWPWNILISPDGEILAIGL